MILTLKQIVDINSAVKSLDSKVLNKIKITFNITNIISKTESSSIFFRNNHRDLVIKFGITDEEGNTKVRAENELEFLKEYNDLCNIEEEINLPILSIDDFEGLCEFADNELKPIYLHSDFFRLMGDIIQ